MCRCAACLNITAVERSSFKSVYLFEVLRLFSCLVQVVNVGQVVRGPDNSIQWINPYPADIIQLKLRTRQFYPLDKVIQASFNRALEY